jgi:hypothetical protein
MQGNALASSAGGNSADPLAATMPLSARLGNTGASVISGGSLDLTLPLSARFNNTARAVVANSRSPELVAAEALFFADDGVEKERVFKARHNYPSRKTQNAEGSAAPLDFNGLEEESVVPRRIMGFGLGFEKIFATTSIKLPVSAYTIFVELHLSHKDEIFSRCFNGLHTVFDLKKWVYEKLLVPMSAYDLSYAEPGKAMLTEQLRLLTTQDSLDTRTLATTRAVHRMYKGIPGVHSINDVGVTRLYVRLKCRTCGDLLNSLQTCRKMKQFGPMEARPDQEFIIPVSKVKKDPNDEGQARDTVRRMTFSAGSQNSVSESNKGVPGMDPTIEDCWYEPDQKKHCLFHTRGFEFYEASTAHGSHAELARIYISCGKEPSKKLKIARNVLKNKGPGAKISY